MVGFGRDKGLDVQGLGYRRMQFYVVGMQGEDLGVSINALA